jgi:hypothetical protein
MAPAATPMFYRTVELDLNFAVLFAFLLVDLVAFVNCLTQRADAFPVVGSLTKQAWLAILGAAVLVTLICTLYRGGGAFLGFIGVTAAAIYLLDVRPALRDTSNGTGNW